MVMVAEVTIRLHSTRIVDVVVVDVRRAKAKIFLVKWAVGKVDMPIVSEEATIRVHKIRTVVDVDARRAASRRNFSMHIHQDSHFQQQYSHSTDHHSRTESVSQF